MPVCTGCSKEFRFLAGPRCEDCLLTPSTKPREEWPHCVDCSKRFEFLEKPHCFACHDRAAMPPPSALVPLGPSHDQNRDVEHAMLHPANARTHGVGGPYVNPYHRQGVPAPDENDPRYHQGQLAYEAFANGYANAHAKSDSHVRPAKSKFRGIRVDTATPKPGPKVSVVVRKIVNRFRKGLLTPFNSQMVQYEETTLWSDIEDDIVIFLDGIYSKWAGYEHRIRSKTEISIQYNLSNVIIDQGVVTKTNATLRDVWRKSTEEAGLHVTKAAHSKHVLELCVWVDYPTPLVPLDADNDEDISTTFSRKRRTESLVSATSTTRSQKRASTGVKYYTRITKSQVVGINTETFYVSKLTAALPQGDSDDVIWEKSDEDFKVFIEKTHFDSGKTKRAYKLRFDGSKDLFAAKQFFFIGNSESVTPQENFDHLKEELTRQLSLKVAIDTFNKTAQDLKVPVYDICVADAFLLRVSGITDDEQAWLVDPLLTSAGMRKFSGTDQAGANNDFAGKTCDALAHFTLVDSDDFVPVDIQGIDSPVLKGGIRGANALTLLDGMAHSKAQTMGLGDDGGIRRFCEQHRCNAICKKLNLPDIAEELAKLAEEGGDKDASHTPEQPEEQPEE